MIFFFFVKQKTAYEMRISDWSSDVCSSDLALTFIVDLDVIPMIEGRADPLRRNRVGLLQVIECGVGKDHPPAKSIVGPIAFDNGYLAARIMQFHQQAKIQSCRAAAYASDVHVVSGYSTLDRKSKRLK